VFGVFHLDDLLVAFLLRTLNPELITVMGKYQ